MAAGGGATSAYKCQVHAYELVIQPTTTLRTQCARLDQALAALARGEQVTVAGADMAALQMHLAQAGVRVRVRR